MYILNIFWWHSNAKGGQFLILNNSAFIASSPAFKLSQRLILISRPNNNISPKIELKWEHEPSNWITSPSRLVSSFNSLLAPSINVSPNSKNPPGRPHSPLPGSHALWTNRILSSLGQINVAVGLGFW